MGLWMEDPPRGLATYRRKRYPRSYVRKEEGGFGGRCLDYTLKKLSLGPTDHQVVMSYLNGLVMRLIPFSTTFSMGDHQKCRWPRPREKKRVENKSKWDPCNSS